MKHVDNSGKGNCLYYAYSISLMYYLRHKNDPAITESIFKKLGLSDGQKTALNNLLKTSPGTAFEKRRQIKGIIEPILGPATRALAAKRTEGEYLNNPTDSPLYASAVYGIEYHTKSALNGHHLSHLIDNKFDIPLFTDAEIYRVSGIKSKMDDFTKEKAKYILKEFNNRWQEKFTEIGTRSDTLTAKDIKFYKEQVLDTIINDLTIDFFKQNNHENLKAYTSHLNTNFTWGAEENLLSLHRAIQGERKERNEKGEIETHYDTEIILQIHINGHPTYHSTPTMILNNQGNVHWTSKIPGGVYGHKPNTQIPEAIPSESAADKSTEKGKGNTPRTPNNGYNPQLNITALEAIISGHVTNSQEDTEKNSREQHANISDNTSANLTLTLLSGIAAVGGIALIVVAFVALNVLTMGAAGIATAAAGACLAATGTYGLFATAKKSNASPEKNEEKTYQPPQHRGIQ